MTAATTSQSAARNGTIGVPHLRRGFIAPKGASRDLRIYKLTNAVATPSVDTPTAHFP